MSGQRVDWDRIEQEYVDHGAKRIGEEITPSRRLGDGDIEDIFAGRPLADEPRHRITATWKAGAPEDLDIAARRAASAEGVPLAALVRKSMREYIARHHHDAEAQAA